MPPPRSASRTRSSRIHCRTTSCTRSPPPSERTCRSSCAKARSSGRETATELAPLDLPTDYAVLLVLPKGEKKTSTAEIYERFDEREGAEGFDQRRADLHAALARVEGARDLALLPKSDLAISPLADDLRALGAFRTDVTGAGPAVFGLFERDEQAAAARKAVADHGPSWLARPVSPR